MIKKISISGSGGQGVKLMSLLLSKIITKLDYNVSLVFDYDSAMRGGGIDSFIVYSDEKIGNPLMDKADIHIKLSESRDIEAGEIICQKGLCNGKEIDFKKIARNEFGNVIVVNMLSLGFLLKKLNISLDKIDFDEILPERNKKQNIEAIKYGYSLKE